MHWWMFYGVLTLGAVAIVWNRKQRPGDTWGAVLLLAAMWTVWNLFHWLLRPRDIYFPITDAIATGCLIWLWKYRMNGWKTVFIGLFMAECYIHVIFFALGDHSREARYNYDLKQNIIYMGQLACVTWAAVYGRVCGRG